MLLADGMSLENAVVLFILMLVAQVPLLVTAVVAYVKSKTVIKDEVRVVVDKVDQNTKLTEEGTSAAATAATDAKTAAQEASKKLNGGLDEAVRVAIEPLREEVRAHAAQDEKNMNEVRQELRDFVTNAKLDEFSRYVHERNHDLLNAMNQQTLKVTELVLKLEGMAK